MRTDSSRPRQLSGHRGFTIVEVMVAMVVVAVFVLAAMSSMALSRVQSAKDKDRGTIMDFAVHYLELAKGMPFSEMTKGRALNPICDGTLGAPNIRIPITADWFSITDSNYVTFHPELIWLVPRKAEMRVTLTTTQTNGFDHTKTMRLDFRWEAPFQAAQKLTARMDLARFADL